LRSDEGVALELGTGAGGQKTRMMGLLRTRKKFNDIFRRVDSMHQRDRRTDRQTHGQTPGDSKDRAYA